MLRLITGEYKPDKGDISRSGECTIGFLNQDLLSYDSQESILHVAMQAFEEAMALQKKIDEVLKEMEVDYKDSLVDKLTKLQERFEALDGYSIQSKAEEILEGLGFSTKDLEKPLKTFSGGWRMRVMLAKLLLAKPSLLLLDEPTNHLDLPSIQWIEKYLENYEGAIIVVSHDRYFLDNTVKTVVEVAQQNLHIYAGNYQFYLEEKALRAEIQKGAFENQQSKIRQTERFIDRFKAKASKARQVQSRVKSLERMDLIEDVVEENARVNFRFKFSKNPGRTILSLKNISKSYGDLNILKNTHAIIERGDKIALIGANGKGKSTLLRIIAGTENIEGERTEGHNVLQGFFAQHQLEALNVNNSMLDELKEAGSDKSELELRTILGCFLFSNDDVFKKIKVLSGGEKSRVALAKTLISEANFLLLDEPTNHLDIVSVNILIQALQQYEGTYIVISHDRHFVSQVANKIWFIEDNEIKEYPGTYEEYCYWQEQRVKNSVTAPVSSSVPKKSEEKLIKNITEPGKEIQKELKSLQNQLEKTETRITELENKKAKVEEELAKPDVYSNVQKLADTNSKYELLRQQLEQEQQKWDEYAEKIQELEDQK
ncbi:ABC transporter ATP-binding protein [Sporocytophaga myxococcoides]|uniref:ABC transporter ATP-binding protein n=1 Tax=Sporocytophaga myxococcoides TaxID=153721 RepID=A0A098LKK8_9BACT|nr:ABC transporter ATP-binding protein [Sporocytophaga myxococcoides]